MRITLAYPFENHDPDETIDVGPEVGKRLIRDGRARRAAETVDELKQYAAEAGIDLRGATRKADIESAIEAAEKTRASKTTVLPDTGTTREG